jgi:glycosyltransferase involved in cell wall biosynthesis
MPHPKVMPCPLIARSRIVVDATAGLSGGKVYAEEVIPRLVCAMPDYDFTLYGAAATCLRDLVATGRLQLITPHITPKSLRVSGILKLIWRELIFPIKMLILRPALVFSTSNFFSPLLRVFGIQVVLAIHNLTPFHNPKWYVESSVLSRARTTLLRHLTKYSARGATAVVAFSGYAKQILTASGTLPERIRVIYHGAPLETRGWAGQDSDTVLVVSHYLAYKRIEHVILAFAQIMRTTPLRYRLLVQGVVYDKKYFEELTKLVAEHGLIESVELGRGLGAEDLMNAYGSAAMLVFPAIGENCPVTLLEAMKVGIPIVASDVPPLPELCGPAAAYYSHDRVDVLAERIEELLVHRNKLQELSLSGLERSKKFSWASSAQQTEELLRNVLDGRQL